MKKHSPFSFRQMLFGIVFLLAFSGMVIFLFSYGRDEKRFTNLTAELFAGEMRSNTLSMHYTLANPADFGIGDYEPVLSCYDAGRTLRSQAETENTLAALKALNPDITIWAVEPENAAILAGGTVGTHIQMGIGDGVVPKVLNRQIYEDIAIITDEEALQTSKDLARLEGLMCGISSGTNVAAAIKLARKLGSGKTVVTLLPDTAERYFSTPLFE